MRSERVSSDGERDAVIVVRIRTRCEFLSASIYDPLTCARRRVGHTPHFAFAQLLVELLHSRQLRKREAMVLDVPVRAATIACAVTFPIATIGVERKLCTSEAERVLVRLRIQEQS